MKRLVFKAINENCGFEGTWQSTTFKIYDDLSYKKEIKYIPMSYHDKIILFGHIDIETYNKLIKIIIEASHVKSLFNDGSDGEKWSFALYENGQKIWNKKSDYIGNIKEYKAIENFLTKKIDNFLIY